MKLYFMPDLEWLIWMPRLLSMAVFFRLYNDGILVFLFKFWIPSFEAAVVITCIVGTSTFFVISIVYCTDVEE